MNGQNHKKRRFCKMNSDKEDSQGPAVEVLYLNTNEEAKFHAGWSETVQSIWEKSYTALGEARREGDTFECQDGSSLMSQLGSTLEQLREQKICHGRKFQIRGPAGGAWLA
jgi:hypothetical protein